MRLRKMKPSSIFRRKHRRKLSWNCSPCKYPKTLSFQGKNNHHDGETPMITTESEASCFRNSMQVDFPCTMSDSGDQELLSDACLAMESNRLTFEPNESSSILPTSRFPFKECMVLALESDDPYMDFTSSMEQMIKGYGLKANGVIDWSSLEELLTWFLKMNNRKNHDFIVAAFVDLCMNLSAITSSSSSCALSNI